MKPGIRPDYFAWRTAVFRGRIWAKCWLFWTGFYLSPLLTGWLLKLVFDELEQSGSVTRFLVLLGVTESVSWVLFAISVWLVAETGGAAALIRMPIRIIQWSKLSASIGRTSTEPVCTITPSIPTFRITPPSR